MQRLHQTIRALIILCVSFLLVAGCAQSGDTVPEGTRVKAENRCHSGEVWMCESRSASGISDGRHGNVDGRQRSCSCARASDLEDMIPASLPVEPF